MGRAIETLWVEPRLRGFVVLDDPRNPPSKVGRLTPYWIGDQETVRCSAVPAMDATSAGARLKIASLSAARTSMRASGRDLRRRVRDGLMHHEFPPGWAGLRWVPLALAVAALVMIGLEVLLRVRGSSAAGVPGMLAIGALCFGAMFLPASRVNTQRTRLDGGFIEAELRSGEVVGRPLDQIERVKMLPMAASIRFRDGMIVRFYVDKQWDQRVVLALRHPHLYGPAKAQRRQLRVVTRRCLLLYFPLASLPLGLAYAWGQMPAFGLPGTSPFVGPLVGVMMYATFCLHVVMIGVLTWAEGAMNRWSRRRDRRRRLRDRGDGGPRAARIGGVIT